MKTVRLPVIVPLVLLCVAAYAAERDAFPARFSIAGPWQTGVIEGEYGSTNGGDRALRGKGTTSFSLLSGQPVVAGGDITMLVRLVAKNDIQYVIQGPDFREVTQQPDGSWATDDISVKPDNYVVGHYYLLMLGKLPAVVQIQDFKVLKSFYNSIPLGPPFPSATCKATIRYLISNAQPDGAKAAPSIDAQSQKPPPASAKPTPEKAVEAIAQPGEPKPPAPDLSVATKTGDEVQAKAGREATVDSSGPVGFRDVSTGRPIKALQFEKPLYPRGALINNVEGSVEVHFTVGVDGVPKALSVVAETNGAYFHEAVLDAVKKARFQPTIIDGHPVEQQVSYVIYFVIR